MEKSLNLEIFFFFIFFSDFPYQRSINGRFSSVFITTKHTRVRLKKLQRKNPIKTDKSECLIVAVTNFYKIYNLSSLSSHKILSKISKNRNFQKKNFFIRKSDSVDYFSPIFSFKINISQIPAEEINFR